MRFQKRIACLALSGIALAALPQSKAQVLITEWNFENGSTSGVNASPAPSSGSGTASTLGMTFNGSSEDSGLAKLDSGTSNSDPNSKQEWKVRGTNGWSAGAGIASQGAQFSVSTLGFTGVSVSFDWYPSSNGEADLAIQYTTDGSTWTDATASQISIPSGGTLSVLTNSTNANLITGAYLNTTAGNTWYDDITLNLSGLASASNDPSFGIRLVNAATGAATVQATGGGALGTSGNWSFDNVKFDGVAIPETSTYALIIGAGALLIAAARRRGLLAA
jgi:hypothetical protein